jgi:hypothetical protein
VQPLGRLAGRLNERAGAFERVRLLRRLDVAKRLELAAAATVLLVGAAFLAAASLAASADMRDGSTTTEAAPAKVAPAPATTAAAATGAPLAPNTGLALESAGIAKLAALNLIGADSSIAAEPVPATGVLACVKLELALAFAGVLSEPNRVAGVLLLPLDAVQLNAVALANGFDLQSLTVSCERTRRATRSTIDTAPSTHHRHNRHITHICQRSEGLSTDLPQIARQS